MPIRAAPRFLCPGERLSHLRFGTFAMRLGIFPLLWIFAPSLTDAAQRLVDLRNNDPHIEVRGPSDVVFAHSTAVGDVDGDGLDDLIIGAPVAGPMEEQGIEAVYVVFGSTEPRELDVTTESADVTVFGTTYNTIPGERDMFGVTVATGDVNGDEYADVIIGGAFASEVYLFYGRSRGEWPQTIDLDAGEMPDVFIRGEGIGALFATGDINGDDTGDLVIAGGQYIWGIFGREDLPGSIDLRGVDEFEGAVAIRYQIGRGWQFRRSLILGDVNGDSVQDLIFALGGFTADLLRTEVYMVYGGG